jgi:hypothetical protein
MISERVECEIGFGKTYYSLSIMLPLNKKVMLKKIISGGQTGADVAGLYVAIKHGIHHGGAIPKGRLTEDGMLSEKYNLEEMTSKSYPKRTEKNVVDSDGTVIFTHGKLTGGN